MLHSMHLLFIDISNKYSSRKGKENIVIFQTGGIS